MTPTPLLRKPKLHFDTAANPSHVTFDDGKELRRNIPWLHYVEARWEYGEPDMVAGGFIADRGSASARAAKQGRSMKKAMVVMVGVNAES